MKERIHQKICDNMKTLVDWYESRLTGSYVPFYSSFDIRDSNFKVGNIDGNIFPAGFNNICHADKESAPDIVHDFMSEFYGGKKKVLLLTEDHLKNAYYWDNIFYLQQVLLESGLEVQVGMLFDGFSENIQMESFQGHQVEVAKIYSENGQLRTKAYVPDLVISNNDFSQSYESIDFSNTLMAPARELGWFQRRKFNFFKHYNGFAAEFAEILGEDPWLFSVETHLEQQFDVTNEDSRDKLAGQVDGLLKRTHLKYQEHNIESKPFVVVKNNAGTYGLAVTKVSSAEEVLSWNYKAKKKMKAAKGGGGVSEVIFQEGIPSALKSDSATAEPVIYMVGHELVGGFLRTHGKKDAEESLNSPGAVYQRLCLSDLKIRVEGCIMENVYGWAARLGLLSMSREAQDLGISRR